MTAIAQETQRIDLEYKQGDEIRFTFRFRDVELTGAWKSQIREKKSPNSVLVAEFGCSASQEGTDTVVELVLLAVDNKRAGTFRWDLENAGRTWLDGNVRVSGDVTNG